MKEELEGFLIVVNIDGEKPQWTDTVPFEDDIAGETFELAPVTVEVESTFTREITLENHLEEVDLFSRPEEEARVDLSEASLARAEELEQRLARRRAELEPHELHRKVRGMSTKCLKADIRRLEESREAHLRTAGDLRQEAARVSPSAKNIWHGKSLSFGSS